jgi:hypothetical protein
MPPQVLTKWRADVSRVLTVEGACTQIMSKHATLAKAAHGFLHKCAAPPQQQHCLSGAVPVAWR